MCTQVLHTFKSGEGGFVLCLSLLLHWKPLSAMDELPGLMEDVPPSCAEKLKAVGTNMTHFSLHTNPATRSGGLWAVLLLSKDGLEFKTKPDKMPHQPITPFCWSQNWSFVHLKIGLKGRSSMAKKPFTQQLKLWNVYCQWMKSMFSSI